MTFWDNATKTVLILLRFESATNNEQEKPQLVVFFPPTFVFRSFSEKETHLERRAILCSTTSPFQISKNSAGNSF